MLNLTLFTGEPFQKTYFDYIRNGFNGTIINLYGNTETFGVSEKLFLSSDNFINGNEIGTTIDNVRYFVLDQNMNEVSSGEIGELCVSGKCLARGYLNKPEESSKKFISNPFRKDEERKNNLFERIYRTGDLVKVKDDERLELVGRNDSQVNY